MTEMDRPAIAASPIELDHVVIGAASLAEGVAWCRDTLGFTPAAGGEHPKMGTHNRIFDVSSARYPRAYLEILAIDPLAAAPEVPRWFGLDEPALRQAIAAAPRLIGWVGRCTGIERAVAQLRDLACDPGEAQAAERQTPQGLLQWRITIRADGRRVCGGAVPALIEWGDVHPSKSLAPSGVALTSLQIGAAALRSEAGEPRVLSLASRLATWLGPVAGVDAALETPLRVTLDTMRGPIILDSI